MSKTRLTPREQGVLEMHEAGYARRDIAVSYGITRGLVDLIVARAKRKLETTELCAVTRVNDILRKVLGHADCPCENDDECPCVIGANYLRAFAERNGTDNE